MRNPFGWLQHRARNEALVWLARLKRGLRQDEGPELRCWLEPRSHRSAIAKAAVEWHGPEVLAVLSELFPIDPARLEPRRGTHPAIRVAAALAPICVAVLLGLLMRLFQKDPWYVTTPKETKQLALEDGSRVALNGGTAISVAYLEHIRSVLMARGEAVFTVASEPYRPFDLQAAGRHFATTSGTFDVRIAAPNRLSITVLAGTVTALPPLNPRHDSEHVLGPMTSKPILIEPLQMLTIAPDEESGQTLTEQDVRALLGWQRGT